MVDFITEYGYYVVGITLAIFSIVTSYFAARKYVREWRIEQRKDISDLVTGQVNRVIDKIDTGQKINEEKFVRTDAQLTVNANATHDIQHDIEILENDFKVICQKIGKHDYAIDKILPEYIDLKSSIHNFKNKIDSNLLSNKEEIFRNTDNDSGQEGEK